MDITIFGYKLNLEVLILIGVVYLILVGHLFGGCCNMNRIMESFDNKQKVAVVRSYGKKRNNRLSRVSFQDTIASQRKRSEALVQYHNKEKVVVLRFGRRRTAKKEMIDSAAFRFKIPSRCNASEAKR